MKLKFGWLLTILFPLVLGSCGPNESLGRYHYFFMDMAYSPAVDSQMLDRLYKHKGNMVPPENTMPYKSDVSYEINETMGIFGLKTDGKMYHRVTNEEVAFAQEVAAPDAYELGFWDYQEMLARGKNRYDIYCAPCHGVSGKADGPVQKKIPHVSQLVRKVADKPILAETYNVSRIYLAASIGIRTMSGYASQIEEADRWALSYYVKVMQEQNRQGNSEN